MESTTVTTSSRTPKRASTWRAGLVAGIVLTSLGLELRGLGHPFITYYDESFHANVAKNLLKHPLRPTLVERPYLPYDYRDWRENHLWLHKGIVPLWQMALSMRLWGVNTFALRLPSAILCAASVLLTYGIGREMMGRRAGLIAAAFQALSGSFAKLAHGFWFSDHVDTALIFYVELGVFCLARSINTGAWRWVVLAGVSQGLAFLCKSYPALIVGGVAVGAWTLGFVGFSANQRRITGKQLLGLFATSMATVTPWTIWCMVQFPREFWHEMAQIRAHLNTDIEGWAAPWDRLLFDYAILLYFVLYAPVLVAVLVNAPATVKERRLGPAMIYLWGLIVLGVFTIAATKTPSATMIGMAPMLLILAWMMCRAWEGDRSALAAWVGVTAIGLLNPVEPHSSGWGYPESKVFGAIMRQEMWVFRHVLAGIGMVCLTNAAVAIFGRHPRNGAARMGVLARRAGLLLAVVGTTWFTVRLARESWDVGAPNPKEPHYTEIAAKIRENLPGNAALLVDRRFPGEFKILEFLTDRTCYEFSPSWKRMGRQIQGAGGVPFIASTRELPFPRLFSSTRDGWTVYSFAPEDGG